MVLIINELHYSDEEADMILKYQEITKATTIRDAIINAISVAYETILHLNDKAVENDESKPDYCGLEELE